MSMSYIVICLGPDHRYNDSRLLPSNILLSRDSNNKIPSFMKVLYLHSVAVFFLFSFAIELQPMIWMRNGKLRS